MSSEQPDISPSSGIESTPSRPPGRPRESRSPGLRSATLAVCLLLCTAPATGVLASTESRALVESGSQQMAGGDFQGALNSFEEALRADPGDAQASFFAGAALNRLGRGGEALRRFERVLLLTRVSGLQSAHPDLDFERGWALVREQRHAEALAALQRYERDHPGRGQTAELIGRALIGLGRDDEAAQWLRRAEQRDPKLAPTVKLASAMSAGQRGETGLALQELHAVPPTGPVGNYLERSIAQL
ncbi:MAG: tetratricopeptide repeat protein, partial [Gammaproteobacteria bacterium]|nr:tetratricopeptide repeat protein [Gammaproteobacteria bacterium]